MSEDVTSKLIGLSVLDDATEAAQGKHATVHRRAQRTGLLRLGLQKKLYPAYVETTGCGTMLGRKTSRQSHTAAVNQDNSRLPHRYMRIPLGEQPTLRSFQQASRGPITKRGGGWGDRCEVNVGVEL